MPSIFEQLNNTNRTRQETVTPEISLHVKKRLHRVGQQLVAQRNVISVVSLFIIIGWLWLSYEPVPESLQPIQQTLTLPNVGSTPAPTEPFTQPINDKPLVVSASPTLTESIKPTHQPSAPHSHGLGIANQKAIEFALSGQASQATRTLEQALLDDPQAGVVFDNLRRLYAGFASQSYQLALEPSKPKPITVELASSDTRIVVQLDTPKANNDVIKPTTTLSAVNTMRQSSATNHNDLETIAEPQAPITPVEKNLPATAPIKTTTPAIIEPTPAQKEAAQRKANQQAIHQALKQWSEAWSKQDVKGYFSSYAPSYSPKSTTRKAWMDYRQERILAPKRIKVELSDIKIVLIKPTLAKVSFLQNYTSDTLNARDQKSLELELINNTWLIITESGR